MKNLELFRTFAENMEKDIIKSYVRYLKLQRNMSPNTLDAYQRDLRKLLDYLDHEEKDARDVTLEDPAARRIPRR